MPDKKLTDKEILKALECCMKICEEAEMNLNSKNINNKNN